MPFLPPNQQRQSTEGKKHEGKSRTKICMARTSRGSSHYRLIPVPAARARPRQQTRRPPLLMLIYGTDRLTVQPFSEPK